VLSFKKRKILRPFFFRVIVNSLITLRKSFVIVPKEKRKKLFNPIPT
jgi:hypothetical protein